MSKWIYFLLIIPTFSIAALPKFLLGENEKWGMEIAPQVESSLKLRLGTRLHTITEYLRRNDKVKNTNNTFQDMYIRRGRVQLEAKYQQRLKLYFDLRNDTINKGDSGEGQFNLGDGFIQVSNLFNVKALFIKLFRGKVDVSRSQTISSSKLLNLDRAHVSNEASNFVSHNRRASNIQLVGDFDHIYFQAIVGDGVQKSKFNDAKGNSLSSGAIDSQQFMIGGKVRFAPLDGWEDHDIAETYFGQGKHVSAGFGTFHTGRIEYRNSAATQVNSISRTLLNGEFSFHYKNLSFQSEWFRFNGVIEDFSTATKNKGSSEGYYAHAEYVFSNLSYIAPFIRYENWDRFKQKSSYDQTSQVYGLNWYLKGNNIRVGLFYQLDQYDSNLQNADARGRIFDKDKTIKLTTMWHL